MKKKGNFMILVLVISIIGGLIGASAINLFVDHEKKVMTEWYEAENLIHVSPHHLRKGIAKADESFIIVDLRSQEEYEREHIIGAINIPAYASPEKSAYGDVERIVNAFKELPQDKDIIVYCYSIPCMTGRKIGKMLVDHDIYVQQLGIGWNEWRYFWNLWNHEHEWNETNVMDYVYEGPEPGAHESYTLPKACAPGSEFDC
jgi:hypothetical protein